jgi:CRP-like cAMP-binding protein
MLHASNAILACLTERDLRTLGPHLKPVYLKQKTILYESGESVPSVYFPTNGVVSLVVTLSTGETTEAVMVGRDGAVGIASALDGRTAFNRAIVQLSGEAISCDPAAFRGVAMQSENLISIVMRHEQSENLISIVMRHEQTMFAQAQQSTACMATHDVEARLCRWLLRARDLSGSDELPFTQEFLGQMLGVRRTSVTIVAKSLQAAGMIKYTRGHIQILDVEGLQDSTCECFETVKQQYRQLLLNPNSGD